MPRITVATENDAPIEIHYEDHGSGQPVVLIHGYPLNGNSWERQERELLAASYRCISYDREIARYLGTHGSARISKAALLGVIPPFVRKTEDNPEGVDGQVFEGIKAAILKDRYAFFKGFLDNFNNVDVLSPDRISDQAWQAMFNVAVGSSPYASYVCVDTWTTDFREDLPKIDVPTLVLHGTEDRILPFEATAGRLNDLIADVTVVPVQGGPHNIGWTHSEEVNASLLSFLACTQPPPERGEPMEFLVEFEVNVPDGAQASEIEARNSAEAFAAARLVDEGHLLRLWKPPAAPAETKALGLYCADSEAQLTDLLRALPIYDWMNVTVTPLEPHPNDPGPPTTVAAATRSRR